MVYIASVGSFSRFSELWGGGVQKFRFMKNPEMIVLYLVVCSLKLLFSLLQNLTRVKMSPF